MKNRNNDLHEMNRVFESKESKILLLYGRHGSGKSATVLEFAKEKKAFYYHALNASKQLQYEMLSKELNQIVTDDCEHDYSSLFRAYLDGHTSKSVVIIDEFQLIDKKHSHFLESIISLMNDYEVMFILVSSELPWIRKEFLPRIDQLKQKTVEVMEIKEWGFLDIVRAFENYETKELVYLYGIFGGVPGYLEKIDPDKSVKENVINLILEPNGALFHEAENYLSRELREISVYDTIIYAIAQGNTKLNDLYHVTGYSRAKISVYLKNLSAFDVIEKVESFETGGWDNVKKGVYVIKNQLINFWFKFVYSRKSQLLQMSASEFYDKYIAEGLDKYLNLHFINICREYLLLMNYAHQLPLKLKSIGTWVGKQGRIDIVGQNEIREKLVAKCYWDDRLVTHCDFKELLETSKQAKIEPKYYYLFASKDFDDKLQSLSERLSNVNLINLKNF
ncbi:ATP-binding protein [Eubacterium oxidoreducens]|uniref:ATP-binding protein n=1 Tax=Eubacterium oxidoreducens TaxID=1732 RepID=UPI00115FEAD7|nr:ATP-binding protein [Eubacterium oxidoreducens]